MTLKRSDFKSPGAAISRIMGGFAELRRPATQRKIERQRPLTVDETISRLEEILEEEGDTPS